MENVSHTLAGLVLARSGLDRTTPLATTALLVGANLPDVDLAWSSFRSALVYYHYHRGWTHSLLGFTVLTILLWAALLGIDRWCLARRAGTAARARALPLLAAAAIGVGSHLLMDAANSYGLRPLLPWSDGWMYGDLWVIVDPWLWLFLGGAAYMTGRRGPRRDMVWSMGAAAAAIVVLSAPIVPAACRAAWSVGLLLTVALGRAAARRPPAARRSWIALAGLSLTLGYAGLCLASHHAALGRLESLVADDPGGAAAAAVLPRPVDPLRWEAFVADGGAIRHRTIGAMPALDPAADSWDVFERRSEDRAVRSLSKTCAGRVVLEFFRFPFATIEDEPGGGRSVVVRDARYTRRGRGFAVFAARLDRDGAPVIDPAECP
ncbi:MAG: hypothetical protein AUH92_02445 [Acidobacteria bacterium 13_1_40CM_4_69_4]|nr:MAG: hypothetical protein AUH92_02445 [Acidobacteria bacterium 13_1_40CM_4_69_4]